MDDSFVLKFAEMTEGTLDNSFLQVIKNVDVGQVPGFYVRGYVLNAQQLLLETFF